MSDDGTWTSRISESGNSIDNTDTQEHPYNIVRQAMGLDKPDMVNHPAHYTDSKIEVWDYIIDKNLTYCLGNVVKYVSRAGKKGSPDQHLEDLKKAQAYLKREIERVEAGE